MRLFDEPFVMMSVMLVRISLKDEWDRARAVKRTFTEVGFARSQLPKDLYGSMSAYHHNNKDFRVPEEWNDGGVIVNWWEAEVSMVHIPPELKVRSDGQMAAHRRFTICKWYRDIGSRDCKSSWRLGLG